VRVIAIAACLLAPAFASAQLIINDEQTFTGVTETWSNGFRLGSGANQTGVIHLVNSTLNSGAFGILAEGENSSGTINIGTGSVFNFSSSTVDTIGWDGAATVNVAAGGRFDTRQVILGRVAGSSGTVNLDGANALWQHLTWYADVGRAGSGTVNVLNGARITAAQRFVIGGTWTNLEPAGGTGTLTVDGTGSSVTFGNSSLTDSGLNVGRRGTGTVTISNGGVVEVIGTTNTQNVWVGYQEGGTGTVNIESGGRLTTGGVLRLSTGTDAGDATINVTGANSRLEVTQHAFIGNSGATDATGTLAISNGGAATIGAYAVIGNLAGRTGAVTVDGSGSSLNVATYVHVGSNGTGTLEITNGGSVVQGTESASPNFWIGRNAGAGTVTIDGLGSVLDARNSVHVAANPSLAPTGGTGELLVQDNGLVKVGANLVVRNGGSVELSGGTIEVGGSTSVVGSDASLTGSGLLASPLTIGDGATVSGTGSGITVAGTLSGFGTVHNLTLGGLQAVFSVGAFDLSEIDFTAGAVLNIVVDSLTAEDLVSFNGSTSFNGVSLNIAFSDITPTGAETFRIFNYTGTGEANFNFASVTTPDGWVFSDGVLAIPEPSTYALLLGAVALGIMVLRRRRG
jgi:T5SS/PEP-CTERM-associated repeat protein